MTLAFASAAPISGDDPGSFASVDVAVRAVDRGRLMTLVTGMHGMQVAERSLEVAEVA